MYFLLAFTSFDKISYSDYNYRVFFIIIFCNMYKYYLHKEKIEQESFLYEKNIPKTTPDSSFDQMNKDILLQTKKDLFDLKTQISNSKIDNKINSMWDSSVNKLVNDINKDPNLNDKQEKSAVTNLIEDLKSWDFNKAMSTFFDFVKKLMWPINKEKVFRFRDSPEINNFIKELSDTVDNTADPAILVEKLQWKRDELKIQIKNINWIRKKLWLTYALSRVLDELVYALDSNKSWMRWSSDSQIDKTSNELSIARMSQQVKLGDILVVNKTEQKIWDKLLTQLSDSDIDSSHVMIVTWVDGTTGEITVAHSTQSKVNSNGQWVEVNLSLSKYTEKFNGIAIASMSPPPWTADVLIKNILEKDGKWYDNKAAASSALLGSNLVSNNNQYNCVELFTQSLPDNIKNDWKDITQPSDIFKYLEPNYVTMTWKAVWWS